MFNSSICKHGQVNLNLDLHFLKHNDRQVFSGKLLQPEWQISPLRLYIDQKNENHFEVILSTLRPNNSDLNNKSDTVESMLKSSVDKELFRQINKVNFAKMNKLKTCAF